MAQENAAEVKENTTTLEDLHKIEMEILYLKFSVIRKIVLRYICGFVMIIS